MNIREQWRRMPNAQRCAGKALAGFLGTMLAFTAISRALDSFTIARVSAGAPSYGVLSHEVVLQGATEALGETSITLPAGFPVRELYLREGTQVEVGELIALLDTDSIEEALEKAQGALEDAQLAAAADALHAETPPPESSLEEAQLRLERAHEDAVMAEQNGRSAIAQAESALRYARRERYRLLDEGDVTDAEMDAARKEISDLGYAVEVAVRAAEEAITAAAREIEDAEWKLALAQREEQQAAELTAQKEALERQARGLQNGRNALTIGERQSVVQQLQELLDAEGKITAQYGGVVTGVRIRTGEITSAGGAFLLSEQGGCLFTASATKQEALRLSVGDRVEVVLSGRPPVDAQVTAIRTPEQPGENYTIIAELPDTDVSPTWPGTLTAIKRVGAETALVPLSSLHVENNSSPDRGYVLVLRERSTTMGLQTVAEKLDVQILDRGRNMAAVQAAFAPDDRIVTASSRYLTDGDRVRLETRE